MRLFLPLLQVLADRLNKKRQFTFTPLDEGAETGYGFAENQVLNLECAFIGVERFRIRKKAANVVVCGDAIPPQKFSRPGARLAALGVVNALAREACASVILPSACNW